MMIEGVLRQKYDVKQENDNRFINARRRIVQPMIDQSNRAGRSPVVNVFKNRRRKSSGQSPAPSPGSNAYSPEAAQQASLAYPVSTQAAADLYRTSQAASMFHHNPYAAAAVAHQGMLHSQMLLPHANAHMMGAHHYGAGMPPAANPWGHMTDLSVAMSGGHMIGDATNAIG